VGSEYKFRELSPRAHPPRVIAVVCSTQPLHVAEYFNGLDQCFALQHEYPGETFYAICDNDIFTGDQSPDERRKAILNAASACLALGLDQNKAVLYRLSDLPQALQLLWSIPSLALMLEGERVGGGLSPRDTSYLPVGDVALFAANGISIRATIMCGGPDQLRGCHFARRLMREFNSRYGGPVLTCPAARLIMPKLMLLSEGQPYGNSNLLSPFASRKQLDEQLSGIFKNLAENRAGNLSRGALLYIHRSVCGDAERRKWFEERLAAGREYTRLARMLSAAIATYFSGAAARYMELAKHPDYVWDVLQEGAHLAGLQADQTLTAVRQAIGAIQV
jgi:tryptophanyl-tRNA synthetase